MQYSLHSLLKQKCLIDKINTQTHKFVVVRRWYIVGVHLKTTCMDKSYAKRLMLNSISVSNELEYNV